MKLLTFTICTAMSMLAATPDYCKGKPVTITTQSLSRESEQVRRMTKVLDALVENLDAREAETLGGKAEVRKLVATYKEYNWIASATVTTSTPRIRNDAFKNGCGTDIADEHVVLVFNNNGALFRKDLTINVGTLSYQGGIGRTIIVILLHEIAHCVWDTGAELTGFAQSDANDSAKSAANNAWIVSHFPKTIRAAQKVVQ